MVPPVRRGRLGRLVPPLDRPGLLDQRGRLVLPLDRQGPPARLAQLAPAGLLGLLAQLARLAQLDRGGRLGDQLVRPARLVRPGLRGLLGPRELLGLGMPKF